MNKKCKGCKIISHCEYKDHAKFTNNGITYICPCQTCLIKGICSNTCDKFNQFRFKVTKIYNSDYTYYFSKERTKFDGWM